MTISELRDGLKQLALAFPRAAALDEAQTLLWFQELQDLTYEEWVRAVRFAVREGDDWPTIAKLRKYAAAGGLTPDVRAEKCWAIVRKAISRVGGYASVCFSDPVANAAIRSAFGGWQQLCDIAGDELQWRQRNFCQTYVRLVQCRRLSAELCAPLHGITNQQRSKAGFGVDATVQIECELPPPRLRITGELPPELPKLTGETARPEVTKAASMLELPDALRERKEQRDAAKREAAEQRQEAFEDRRAASIAALKGTQ